MDSELFTVGGLDLHGKLTDQNKDINAKKADVGAVYYQAAKTLQTVRSLAKVLYWLTVIYTLYMLVVMGPMAWVWIKESKKSAFSQKEGLQYLGASTNVTRDDTGWPTTDSLAEASMRAQNAATAEHVVVPPAPKATFIVPRERMSSHVMTPEEVLLKKQKQQ